MSIKQYAESEYFWLYNDNEYDYHSKYFITYTFHIMDEKIKSLTEVVNNTTESEKSKKIEAINTALKALVLDWKFSVPKKDNPTEQENKTFDGNTNNEEITSIIESLIKDEPDQVKKNKYKSDLTAALQWARDALRTLASESQIKQAIENETTQTSDSLSGLATEVKDNMHIYSTQELQQFVEAWASSKWRKELWATPWYIRTIQSLILELWAQDPSIDKKKLEDGIYGSATQAGVLTLQKILNKPPYNSYKNLIEDGKPGPFTLWALLYPIDGKITWDKLIEDKKSGKLIITPELVKKTEDQSTKSKKQSNKPSTKSVDPEWWIAKEEKVEAVAKQPTTLIDAIKAQPLTPFDKKWLKENLWVKDITKIPAWKEGCNGVVYWISDNSGIWIGVQKSGITWWKGWQRFSNWDKYVWDYKNDMKDWKWAYMHKNWSKYVWEFKNDALNWKGDYYYVDWRIGRDGTYKNDNYVEWTEKIQEKTPEKIFPLESLNDVNIKQIWEKYIAPEYTSKRQQEWLQKKGADKWIKVLIQNTYWNQSIALNGVNWIRLLTISDAKKIGDGKNIDLVKFVTVVKKSLWDIMAKEYQTEASIFDQQLLTQYLEDKVFQFDKIFDENDRKDPIRIKQIEKLQNYFSNKNELLIDDTSIVMKNGKKYIQLDLDNKWEDQKWTEDILIPYNMAFEKGWFKPWTFQKTLRKYIIDELFSKTNKTDIFTKVRDQNMKIDF